MSLLYLVTAGSIYLSAFGACLFEIQRYQNRAQPSMALQQESLLQPRHPAHLGMILGQYQLDGALDLRLELEVRAPGSRRQLRLEWRLDRLKVIDSSVAPTQGCLGSICAYRCH